MKKSNLLTLFCGVLLFYAGGLAANSSPRVIEIVAGHDNVFRVPGKSRAVIEAKPGEPLLLRVTAEKGVESAHDHAVHSLVIKQLRDEGWDIRLYEGTHDFLVSAPSKPGAYTIECTVKCGPGHDDMRMKLIVRP